MPSPKRVTSAVYAVFVTLASAFVISSTVQIASAVLAEPPAGVEGGAAGTGARPAQLAPACAAGLQKLVAAVDRALDAASTARDPADAERRYRAARAPEWDAERQRELALPCESDGRATDAMAAVARLDRAAEGAARRQGAELGPVRRTVDSFIR